MYPKRIISFFISLACWQFLAGQCPLKDSIRKEIEGLSLSDHPPGQELRNLRVMYARLKNSRLPADSVDALLFHRLGLVHYSTGNFDSAIFYTLKEINLRGSHQEEILSSPAKKIKSYYNLSVFYDSLGRVAEKNNAIDSCISVGLNAGFTNDLLLYAISDKIQWLTNIGDYARSLQYADLGLKLAAANGLVYTDFAMRIFSWKINALLLMKEYAQASAGLHNKIKDYERAGQFDYIGNLYQLWAAYYQGTGKMDSVLYYNRISFLYNLKRKQFASCASSLNGAGFIYFNFVKDYPKAAGNYFAALRYADRKEAISIFDNLGNLYSAQLKFDSALYYYQQAFDQIHAGTNESGLLKSRNDRFFNGSSEYIVTLVLDKADAHLNWFKTSGSQNVLAKTVETYRLADLLVDQIRQKQYDISSKLFWRKAIRRLYEHAIEACLLKKDAELGFYFFEKSRAVLLDDQLKQERLEKGMQAKETIDAPAAAEQIPDIQLLRKSVLTGHSAIFEIFNGDSSVFTLSITGSEAAISKVSKTAFDSLSRNYLSMLSDHDRLLRQFPLFSTISHNLYILLFGNKLLPAGRLIISPDGAFFPFEALLVSSRDAARHYMLNDYGISYTYSARFLMNRFANDSKSSGKDFMGLAPVHYDFNPELSSLPGSDISLGLISSYFKNAQALSEKSASKNSFLTSFSDYQIVQLYSHAAYDGAGTEPVIYFSDSALHLSDLASRPGPATRLIVLSACETALGQDYKGEGVFSFSRQFATLGIPASVSNLWSVDNESTYRITELFYEGISNGLSTDISLQQAKLRFMETATGEKSLPYYWAPAILTGKPEIIQTRSPFPVWTIYLLAALALSVAAISFLIKPSWFRSPTPRQ